MNLPMTFVEDEDCLKFVRDGEDGSPITLGYIPKDRAGKRHLVFLPAPGQYFSEQDLRSIADEIPMLNAAEVWGRLLHDAEKLDRLGAAEKVASLKGEILKGSNF